MIQNAYINVKIYLMLSVNRAGKTYFHLTALVFISGKAYVITVITVGPHDILKEH